MHSHDTVRKMLEILCSAMGVLLIVVFGTLVLVSGLRILKQWERGPVLRLGKFTEVKGPGLFWLNPVLESIPYVVDMRLCTCDVATQRTLTKDNVPIAIEAVIYYKVTNVEKAVTTVRNYAEATTYLAASMLRDVCGQKTFDQVLSGTIEIGLAIQQSLMPQAAEFGVEVTNVVLKQIAIPERLQNAIALQASAERERRARVILATAEEQQADKMVNASKKYEDNPLAMELRWMNILYEVSKENATVIMIPANIPTAAMGSGISSVAMAMQAPKTMKKKPSGILSNDKGGNVDISDGTAEISVDADDIA
jgi:regulator of protease activity HflC (stomatin/prohibitin superfamily)